MSSPYKGFTIGLQYHHFCEFNVLIHKLGGGLCCAYQHIQETKAKRISGCRHSGAAFTGTDIDRERDLQHNLLSPGVGPDTSNDGSDPN